MIGILMYINSIIINHVTLWYSFPNEWRQHQGFRKRLKFAILTSLYTCLVVVQYNMIATLFITFPGPYQWVAALFLPLVREFNVWAETKLACKASGGNETCQRIACNQDVLVAHLVFVSYAVSSILNFTASTVLIGTDFLINVLICLKLIYLHYNDGLGIRTKKIELLQALLLNEMVEAMVPLCYFVCFMMAYYGPNSEVIGNILNSYWQFSAVDDIGETVAYLCMFFFVDLLSLVICTILLQIFCQIKLYDVFLVLQNEFGWLFNVALVININGYFAFNLIAAANDLTLRFEWLDGDYNYTSAVS
jgi:hypothetical protein